MNNNNNNNNPLPTFTDIARGYLIVNRILLRKNFETLKNRKNAKYFKNIIIKDIPWGIQTPLPPNFPDEFKDSYPSDFSVEFTTLGCNMLKCYKHNYNKPCFDSSSPFVINNLHLACNEACYGVFEEFNQFIEEKFKIIKKTTKTILNKELDFETLSIEKHHSDGTGIEKNFCGVQLTNLKRFAIYPASRWLNDDEGNKNNSDQDFLTKEKFKEISNNEPMKLCDMAGLVDSPPLTWDTAHQNVNFNEEYCERFRKYYDEENDECRTFKHRAVLNYIFGNNVVNQFSDTDALLAVGSPIAYIVKTAVGGDNTNQFPLNPLYTEKLISQKKLERAYFHATPDRILRRTDTFEMIEPRNNNISLCQIKEKIITEVSNDIGKQVVEILQTIGETMLIEESIISSPILLSHLLKYYSKSFINKAFLNVTAKGSTPMCLNVALLIVRTVVVEMIIKTVTKILVSLSQIINIVLSIGIITIIPDILLAKYNIGGYNREITREILSKQRTDFINKLIRETLHSQSPSSSPPSSSSLSSELSFLSINNNNDEKNNDAAAYITPIITPEYIYSLCLLNFHTTHLNDDVINIGHVGIDPEEEGELIREYLSHLRINSAGQRIFNNNNFSPLISSLNDMVVDNDTSKTTTTDDNSAATLENMSENIKKRIDNIVIYDYKSLDTSQWIIANNYDLYILLASILIAFILCYYSRLLLCQFCKIKITVIFLFTFICLYLIWVKFFKNKMYNNNNY